MLLIDTYTRMRINLLPLRSRVKSPQKTDPQKRVWGPHTSQRGPYSSAKSRAEWPTASLGSSSYPVPDASWPSVRSDSARQTQRLICWSWGKEPFTGTTSRSVCLRVPDLRNMKGRKRISLSFWDYFCCNRRQECIHSQLLSFLPVGWHARSGQRLPARPSVHEPLPCVWWVHRHSVPLFHRCPGPHFRVLPAGDGQEFDSTLLHLQYRWWSHLESCDGPDQEGHRRHHQRSCEVHLFFKNTEGFLVSFMIVPAIWVSCL